MNQYTLFIFYGTLQVIIRYCLAYQVIVDKNFGTTGACIPDQQNMWQYSGGSYINQCYTSCKIAGTTTQQAIMYSSSSNKAIKFTMSASKLTDPYSMIGIDFIYAQKTNFQLRLNINNQATITVTTQQNTIYEEFQKLSCYGNLYQFQKQSLVFQGTIDTSNFFVALDQNTNRFYVKQLRIWTNCCQNCDKCASSTQCLICMNGFNKYIFPSGETVCEQTKGCTITNCYSCAKYGVTEVCISCLPNYYLDGSGVCQENQPSSSCPSASKYVEHITLACKTYSTNCWYQYPVTKAWTSCGAKENYYNYHCPYNKQVIIYQYENYSIYQCSCLIQNCQYCTALNGCTSCYPGYNYNTGTQICDPQCASNQYYNTASSSCINCGSNCATCDSIGCLTCINSNYYVSITTPQNCLACSIINCETCFGDGTCSICLSGYQLSPDRLTCSIQCQVYNCQTCNPSNGLICDTCITNYLLSTDKSTCSCQVNSCNICQVGDGLKCDTCTTGYNLNTSTYQCECAVTNCSACDPNDGSICNVCFSNYLLDVSQTLCSCQASNCNMCDPLDGLKCSSCSTGYVLNTSTFQCDCGVQNCQTCNTTDGSICDTCITNYLQSANHQLCSCQITNCNTCQSNDGLLCSTCVLGYLLNGAATQCNCAVSNCQTCNISNGATCDSCIINYLLSANQQICSCQVNNCNSCQVGDGSKCQVCQTGYTLNTVTNLCDCSVANCQSCNPSNGIICDTCITNYLLSANQQICSCQTINCLVCQVNDGQKCQTCQIGYNLNAITQQCDCSVSNCQSCNVTDGTLCDTCISQYLLSANKKSCSCAVSDCLLCQSNDGSKCQTCQTGYTLNPVTKSCGCQVANCLSCDPSDGTICQTCITSYLQSADKKSCMCQVNNCTNCQPANGSICQTCQAGYNLNVVTKQCDCTVQNCQACNLGDGSLCDTCVFQFSQSVDKKQCNCQVTNCIQCDPSDGLKCQNCQNGYILSQAFTCQCSDQNCTVCNPLDGNICQQCAINYSLNTQTLKCDLSVCQVINCQTCTQNNMYKCSLCGQGYYLDQIQDKCLPCAVANCSECISTDFQKCNFCNAGYAINAYQCLAIVNNNSYTVQSQLTSTGYSITITFSQNLINVMINDNIPSITMSIPGYLQYTYTLKITGNKEITAIFIVSQSIKNAKVNIQFAVSKFVSDNSITDLNYIGDIPAFVIVSQQVKAAVAQVAAVTSGVSKSVVSSFVPIAIFGNFYFLVNMIDLTSFLYYLMFLDIRYPINVTEFYGLFKDFQFPFIPNFFIYIVSPNYSPVSPKKFMDMGVNSYLLNNAGQSMTICFFVIGLYILVKIAHKTIPIRRLHAYFSRIIYETWEFGAFFDMMSSVYIYILIGCLLQTQNFDTGDKKSVAINYIMYTIWMSVCIFWPILMGVYISRQKNLKSDKYIQIKISSFISGLKIENENPYHEQNQDIIKMKKIDQDLQNQNNDEAKENADNGAAFYESGAIQSDNFKNKCSDDIIHELAEEEQVGSPVLEKRKRTKKKFKLKTEIRLQQISVFENSTPKNDNEKDILQILQINTRSGREQHVAKYSKLFSSFLYIRKIIFSMIIVFLYGYCYIQLSLLCLLNIVVLIYIAYIQPYDKKSENIKNGVCEVILMTIQVCAFLLVDDNNNDSEDRRLQIGWAIVCFSAFILLWNTVILARDTILSLYEAIKKLLHKNDEFHKNALKNKIHPNNLPFQDSLLDEKNFNKDNIVLKDPEFNRKLTATTQQSKINELIPRSRQRSSISSYRSNLNSQSEINNQLIGITSSQTIPQSLNRSLAQQQDNQQQNCHTEKQTTQLDNLDICKLDNEQFNQNLADTHVNLINFSPQLASYETISQQSSHRKIILNSITLNQFTPTRRRRSSQFKKEDNNLIQQDLKHEDNNNTTQSSIQKQKRYQRNKKSNFSEYYNTNREYNSDNSNSNNANFQSDDNEGVLDKELQNSD